MNRLVECVPNFSEGRNASVVDAIVAAMREVPGAHLLSCESDADHNRTVVTLAGAPEAVAEAAVRGVGKAAELIDLTRHRGAHPRIGSADVVPFVPLADATMEDCIALARATGHEIWERYRMPVYFYEAAALRPERANLENIRKGQFERLREEALRDPGRAPDIGGPELHSTAGATAVGARGFLIACNINLGTPDVEIAQGIARVVRASNGGLPCVKAMGVYLPARNLAQVSMNLTDFERTPIPIVYERVKREAARLGVPVAGAEIVGLVPRRAVEAAAALGLDLSEKFENFSPAKVLENRMEAFAAGQAADAPISTQSARR
ncbi:MAG: glutamate formimidoyltransferase [Candidatus Acidiferrales bacterium]